MNKKTGIFAATYLAVASVWLGGHFGPGFATGVFSAQYYEKYGVIGLFMPLLAMLLTGSVMGYDTAVRVLSRDSRTYLQSVLARL